MTKMHFKQNTTEKLDIPGTSIVALHRNQCSSCKNTYGGMVQLFTHVKRDDHCTCKGMVYAKMFCGDGVVWDENMTAISASSA